MSPVKNGCANLNFLGDSLDKCISISTVSICGNDNVVTYIPYFWGVTGVDSVLSICQSSISCNDGKVLSSDSLQLVVLSEIAYLIQILRSECKGRIDVEWERLLNVQQRRPFLRWKSSVLFADDLPGLRVKVCASPRNTTSSLKQPRDPTLVVPTIS